MLTITEESKCRNTGEIQSLNFLYIGNFQKFMMERKANIA